MGNSIIKDIRFVDFLHANFAGHDGLFTKQVISNDILNVNFIYRYDIGYDNEGLPCTLKNHISSNKLGTFFTYIKFEFDEKDYIDIRNGYLIDYSDHSEKISQFIAKAAFYDMYHIISKFLTLDKDFTIGEDNMKENLLKDKENSIMKNKNESLNFVKQLNEYPFVYCSIEGYSGIFTDVKIEKSLLNSLPKGVYHYDIRHDDDGFGIPATLENHVVVNRLGTFLTLNKIDFDGENFLIINEYFLPDDFHIKYDDWIEFNKPKLQNLKNDTAKSEDNVPDDISNVITMIVPIYDKYDGEEQIRITDSNVIRVNADNKYIPVYANLWSKGWITLSNPNSTLLSREIFFGKCTEEEISIIKKASDKAGLCIGVETILGKEYSGHKEEDMEAFEVTVGKDPDEDIGDITLFEAFKRFSELIGSDDNPYPYNKKCDLFTLRFKDGYEFHYSK